MARGNFGRPEQHRKAGEKGGKMQGKENNPRNFANLSERERTEIARKGGKSSH